MRKKYHSLIRVLVALALVTSLVGVVSAPAGAVTLSAVTITPEFITSLGAITIEVSGDPDAAPNPVVQEAIWVTVKSTDGNDSEKLWLGETGINTKVFSGTLTLVAATGTAGNQPTPTTDGDGKLSVGVHDEGLSADGSTVTSASAADRLDVEYIDSGTVSKYDTAVFDADAPKITAVVTTVQASAIKVEVTTNDDQAAAGLINYKDGNIDGGPQNAGEASGVLVLEYTVNGVAQTPVWVGNEVGSTVTTFYVLQTAEGSYTISVKAKDGAGNVTALPFPSTASIDTTLPVVSGGVAERTDLGTDADLSKVHTGQTTTLKATIAEQGSGIKVMVTTIDLDAAGVFDPLTLDYDAVASEAVVTTTAINTDGPYYLVPSATLLQSAVDAAVTAGTLTKDATNTDKDFVVIGTGEWSVAAVTVAPATTGAKSVTVVATDGKGLANTAVLISVNVVTDAVDPVVASSANTYFVGEEAKAGEVLIITATVSDDVSGVAGVTADLTALAPSTTVNSIYTWTPTTTGGSWSAAPTGTATLAAQTLTAYGEAKPGVYHVKLVIGAAVTSADQAVTLTATDNAVNTGTLATSVVVVVERTTMTLNLAVGYNFISIPKALETPRIWDALAPIVTQVKRVYTYTGGTSLVSAPKEMPADSGEYLWTDDSLNMDIEPGRGYIINMNEAATLSLTFKLVDPIAPPDPLALGAGWSVIGFATRTMVPSMPVTSYLSGLSWSVLYSYPTWDQVRPTLIGSWSSPGFFLDGGNNPAVQLGGAYWVYLTADGTLVR